MDRDKAESILYDQTGITLDDLPDGLPLEEYVSEDGTVDFEGIMSW